MTPCHKTVVVKQVEEEVAGDVRRTLPLEPVTFLEKNPL